MDAYLQALQAYLRFDPPGWVAAHRLLPVEVALAACALGLVLVFFGGGRLFRVVAGPLGVLLGLTLTEPLCARLGLALTEPRLPQVSAAALALLGFLFPPALQCLALALPLGMLCGALADPSQYVLGFAPGFLVGGVVAFYLQRVVAALLASLVGAWLAALGTLASLRAPLPEVAQTVSQQYWGLLFGAGLLAVVGAFFQVVHHARNTAQQRAQSPARPATP